MPNLKPLPAAVCQRCRRQGLTLNRDTNRRTCDHCGDVSVAREAFDDIQSAFNEDRRRGR